MYREYTICVQPGLLQVWLEGRPSRQLIYSLEVTHVTPPGRAPGPPLDPEIHRAAYALLRSAWANSRLARAWSEYFAAQQPQLWTVGEHSISSDQITEWMIARCQEELLSSRGPSTLIV